jgi:CPA2 family monovalent cation:H+ antiporter-2
MSSTAIVVKLMADRLELESDYGRRVMGVLLFQDLAVVPLLVLIPALGSSPEVLLDALAVALVKAGALLAVLLVGGKWVMRWWLTLVVRRKSEELFVLNLLLVTLGLAWLTELAGLSLALGAFVAGMLIAETEFKHQVETDIRPFHDVLLGLFFMTVGMKLDAAAVLDHWPLVLAMTVLPVLFKFGLVTALARLWGAAPGTAIRTGLYLAQAGEFGFVLLALATERKLLPASLQSPVLASMVLSMLLTPIIFMYSNQIVMRLASSDWLLQSVAMTTIAKRTISIESHVIICGFGRSGQNLARLLELEKIPYFALDLDPDRVRQATARAERGLRRRRPAAEPGGRRHGPGERAGDQLPGHAIGAAHPEHRPHPCAQAAGDRAHDRRQRHRAAALRRCDRGRARGDRRLADARQPCAGAGRRADAARAAPGAGPARRALRPVARLFPRRRRRHRRRAAARPAAERDRCLQKGASLGQTLGEQALPQAGVSVVSVRRASSAVLQPETDCAWPRATRWCFPACPSRWPWPRKSCFARVESRPIRRRGSPDEALRLRSPALAGSPWRESGSPSRRRPRAAARERAPASAAPALPCAGRAGPRPRTASWPRRWRCAACRRTGPARRRRRRHAGSRPCCCPEGRR